MAFLAAAAAKKASAPAPAPTPGATSPAPSPAAGAASGSTQTEEAKRSILNVLGKRTDLIPAADRRIMTGETIGVLARSLFVSHAGVGINSQYA